MRLRRFATIIAASFTLLFLAGCVDFTIINTSDVAARVLIQTPDNGSYTKSVRPDGNTSAFSGHGGSYTISVLPNERYLQTLRNLRQLISERLFEERATLTADELARLVNRLTEIEGLLEQEAKSGTSCTGTAPDFSAVNVVLAWDTATSYWSIECSVVSEE